MLPPVHPSLERPRYRSRWRRQLGRHYFTFRRWLRWHLSGVPYARTRSSEGLPYLVAHHATPLLRKLKNVDMWMQHNKVHNLGLALERLDGIVLRPGETFSYWRVLGRPSRRKGYLPGMQLDQGKFRSSTGGGLCQLSNLVFWMAMHTPLTIAERWRHSFDVFPDVNRTQPFGSGATCAYNYIDLQLRNDTTATWQLRLRLSDTHLHGEWRSDQPPEYDYEVYESDHLFRQEAWGYSRHNRIARRVLDRQTGELIRTEPLVENHAMTMYNPLLEGGQAE